MYSIRLDISNDVFDKVLFLLESFHKDKVKLQVEESISMEDKTFNPKNFFAVGDSSKLEIDEYLDSNKKVNSYS